ncbi:MAG: alpha-amylase domain-containing protein [Brevinematia bacterium]
MRRLRFVMLALVVVISLVLVSEVNGWRIMQAFYWNVPTGTPSWYSNVYLKVGECVTDKIDCFYLPPPQKCISWDNNGYEPYDYYDLGAYNQKGATQVRYGTQAQLKALISRIKSFSGVKVMADIVINHNSGGASQYNPFVGSNTWTDFSGVASGRFLRSYYDFHPNDLHSTDGYGTFAGMPDLCQDKEYVKTNITAWLNWLKNTANAGFDFWRLDYVQGYAPWVAQYIHDNTGSPFIIGEYWSSDRNAINSWLNSVNRANVKAFDFPLFYTLKSMCNTTGGSFNMANLSGAGLVGINPLKAVTFVENHDTDVSDPIIYDKMMAYAYTLTAEGDSCVFWKDYYVYNLRRTDALGIRQLLWVNWRLAGGTTTVLYTSSDLYIAQRNGYGSNPGLIVVINDHPSSWLGATVSTKWTNTTLHCYAWNGKDTAQPAQKTTDSSGRTDLWAAPRGYAVYAPVGY